jgi:methyltransferase (TIGR00027 family)
MCWNARMRRDEPSRTARGVALRRSLLERPSTPTGDPGAEARLEADLIGDLDELLQQLPDAQPNGGSGRWIAARTPFFDDAVLRAIDDGIAQIVLLGAGYDGRALRFAAAGVRYFEVDHPATQSDKRRRLGALGIDASDVAFVSADFTEPGLADGLAAAGHGRAAASLFILEGVLRYLPEAAYRSLLATVASVSGDGSVLAVTMSTADAESGREAERDARLAAAGEAVLTVPPRDTALRWLAEAGWTAESVDDAATEAEQAKGQGRLLVRATPTTV